MRDCKKYISIIISLSLFIAGVPTVSAQECLAVPGSSQDKFNIMWQTDRISNFIHENNDKIFKVLEYIGFMNDAHFMEIIRCLVFSKLFAKLIARKFNLPIGGDSADRVEVVPGFYIDRKQDNHHWIAVYCDHEPVLFIDASYWQFDERYKNIIIVGPYYEYLNKYKLVETRVLHEEDPDTFNELCHMVCVPEIFSKYQSLLSELFYVFEIADISSMGEEHYRAAELIRKGNLLKFSGYVERRIRYALDVILDDECDIDEIIKNKPAFSLSVRFGALLRKAFTRNTLSST